MNKKIYLIVAGIILLLVLLVTVISALLGPPQPISETPNPTITTVPTITPRPTDLFIQSVLPNQSPSEPYLPIQKITLVFSEEIEPQSITYNTNPPTEVYIRDGGDGRTIYILPKEKWDIGTTTITITQDTISRTNKRLYNSFVYEMVVDIPQVPEDIFDIE